MIPLLRRARQAETLKSGSAANKPEKTIRELLNLLREHPQVRNLFARFNVPISRLDEIPLKFKKMDVSAKAKDGVIYLNERLAEDGDFVEDAHYILHELTHILQQISGKVDDYGDTGDLDYLDLPAEIEAFREQISFIRDYKGQKDAEKYLDDLLDFHELKGARRADKKRQLGGAPDKGDLKYVRISVKTHDGKELQHHYLDAKKWGAPAGRIEAGETAREAAARELLERTGFKINEPDLKEAGKNTGEGFYEFEAAFEDLEQVQAPQTEIRLVAAI